MGQEQHRGRCQVLPPPIPVEGFVDVPVIFIVENNGYAMGTAISRGTTMAHDICSKAIGYGIDSAVIEGMDVLDVYRGMKPFVENCREKSRPGSTGW